VVTDAQRSAGSMCRTVTPCRRHRHASKADHRRRAGCRAPPASVWAAPDLHLRAVVPGRRPRESIPPRRRWPTRRWRAAAPPDGPFNISLRSPEMAILSAPLSAYLRTKSAAILKTSRRSPSC
jgi:hypothetical protein